MNDLFKNVWAKQPVIELEHALDITLPIALFVIGAAGMLSRPHMEVCSHLHSHQALDEGFPGMKTMWFHLATSSHSNKPYTK